MPLQTATRILAALSFLVCAAQLPAGERARRTEGAAVLEIEWTNDSTSEKTFQAFIVGPEFSEGITSDSGRASISVPAGRFDAIVHSWTAEDEQIFVVFEDINVTGDTLLSATRAMAKNAVVLDAVDENGLPLQSSTPLGCGRQIVFDFAEDRKLDVLSLPSSGPLLYISDLSALRTLALEQCSLEERHAVYLVEHQVPRPLNGDVTLRNEPSGYLSTPVRIPIPAGTVAPSIMLYAGMLDRTSGDRSLEGRGVQSLPQDSVWTGTLFMMPALHPAVGGGVAVGLTRGLFSSALHCDGQRVVSRRGWTPTPNEFSVSPGEAITVGAGPLFPTSHVTANVSKFHSFIQWAGPIGETYALEVTGESSEVYNEGGTLLRLASREAICCDPLPPGAYRVLGRASLASDKLLVSTVALTFDTRRTDGIPPSMTTLRFYDASGRSTRQLRENGSMVFSAEDRIGADPLTQRRPLSPDSVHVSWRRHGTVEWNASTPVLIADDQGETKDLGHPPTGLVYRVDLADALRAAGPVDVRITIADDSGNTAEWIGESAFTAVFAKRRSSRK